MFLWQTANTFKIAMMAKIAGKQYKVTMENLGDYSTAAASFLCSIEHTQLLLCTKRMSALQWLSPTHLEFVDNFA